MSDLNDLSTLEEPISTTLFRDAKKIGLKLKQVLLTESSSNVLREWDLYGPLLNCLFLGTLLTFRATSEQASAVFSSIFMIIWGGAAVVTINAQLLGGTVSFFQSVCLLGYCVFPITVACLFSLFWPTFFVRLILLLVAFVWSTRSTASFLKSNLPEGRRLLSLYPVVLFYMSIIWICFTTIGQKA